MSFNVSMYNAVLNVGGRNRRVVAINHRIAKDSVSVDRMHHILLLDRSHSMSGEIFELMENVKSALTAVHPDDLVTIIWFSGPGEFKTVVQGAKIDEGLYRIVDGLKSTVGTTCFSQPLNAAREVVQDLKALCGNFAITLFTDGCPVVPWGDEEEERRVKEIVTDLAADVIAVNTIGYGKYYNKQLLLDVANMSEYGVYNHSGKISDYKRLFGHNYERVSDLALASIEIEAMGADILYLGDRNTKLVKDALRLRLLSRRRNQVFIVGPDEGDFEFVYDGKIYSTTAIRSPKLNSATIRNLYYAMAYNLYYMGDRETSVDIVLRNLGDKALVDSHMNSFTWEEVENHANKVRKAVFQTKARYTDGVCDENYLPAENAPCLMDAFKILAKGNNFFVAPIGGGRKYNRIGVKVVDTFGRTELAVDEVVDRFEHMVLNEDKMNVSFRVSMPILVHLNPKVADRVGLPRTVRAKQYRTYAIIKDGGLNMREVEAILDSSTFDTLASMGLSMQVIRDEEKGRRVMMDMTSLPVINRAYTATNTEDVFRTVKKVTELKARQKVLNFFLKNVESVAPITSYREEEFAAYTPEQIQVLRDHGINEKFEYSPIQTAKEEVGESYVTRSLDFDMKGFASLPKVEDVLERMHAGTKMTPSQNMMALQIKDIMQTALERNIRSITSADARPFLRELLRNTKVELLEARMFLSIVKMGKILTGGWFDSLEPDGKGNFLYTKEDFTLVVKPKRQIICI